MAEDVVISFVAETKQLDITLDKLELLGLVTKEAADEYRKLTAASVEYTKQTSSQAASATDKNTAALNKLTDALDKNKKKTKEVETSYAGFKQSLLSIGSALGVAFGVAQIISFGKESVKAFAEAEAAAKKLEFSLKSITGTGKIGFNKLIEQAEKLSKISYFDNSDIQRAQAAAAAFGLNADEIERLIPTTLDLAVVLGTDLTSAINVQLRAIEGQTKGLKIVGQDFKATGDTAKNFELLLQASAKGAGQATSALNTTDGAIKNLEKNFKEAKEAIGGFLVGIVTGFKDANTETFKSAKANQDAATSSQKLLAEYEKLTEKGVKPTKEEKERLTTITYQLRTALGSSVVSINKETGALVLNKEAVKEAIKQKLLLSNQEASTLALRVNVLNEEKEVQETQKKSIALEKENLIVRGKAAGLTQENLENVQVFAAKNKEQLDILGQLDNLAIKSANGKIKSNEIDKERVGLLEKLNKLGFDAAAVQKLFNTEAAITPTTTLGKSQEEIDAEKDAAKKLNDAIFQARQDLNDRLLASELSSTDDEYNAKVSALEAQYKKDIEINRKLVLDKKLTNEEADKANAIFKENLNVALVNADIENNGKKTKIISDQNEKLAKERFDIETSNLEKQETEEIAAIEKKYASIKDITLEQTEEREKAILDIKLKYQEIDELRNSDDPQKLAKIAAIKADLVAKYGTFVTDTDAKIALSAEELEQKKIDLAVETAGKLFEIYGALSQSRVENIEAERDALLEANDAEQEALQDKRDKELISQAAFNNQQKQLVEKRKKIEADAQKKINEEKRKADLSNRAQKLFEIAIATARNVTEMGVNPALIPFYIALGAAQAAVVLATPLPKYHTGKRAKHMRGEHMAVIRDDEDIFSPETSRDFAPTFKAIHDKKIKPIDLNNFVGMRSGRLSQSFSNNIKASLDLDYDLLASKIGSELSWQMRGNKDVRVKNIKDLADAINSNYDIRRA